MRLPKVWVEAGAGRKTQTAKSATIDMGDEVFGKGLCPSCHTKMVGPVFCGGRPMLVCWEDRVALPYPDDQHAEHAKSFIPYEPEEDINPFGV